MNDDDVRSTVTSRSGVDNSFEAQNEDIDALLSVSIILFWILIPDDSREAPGDSITTNILKNEDGFRLGALGESHFFINVCKFLVASK